MKVLVKDLRPNPYRRMDKYPIDRDKVEALKCSMEKTEYWDNLLARPRDGKYQIAYGHHRLAAIQEMGMSEIWVNVKEIDDATMLRIMANENMDEWKSTPAVINETVSAAKAFIDAELAKYETWGDFDEQASMFRGLFTAIAEKKPDKRHPASWYFNQVKSQGAGIAIICAFLGGNWKAWMVETALRTINDETVDREAVETFKSTKSAQAFQTAVKTYSIPKAEQKKVAQEIVKSKTDSSRDVKKAVQQVAKEQAKQQSHWQPDPNDIELDQLEQAIREASVLFARTGDKVQDIMDRIEALGVETLSGPEPLNLRTKLVSMVVVLERVAPYLGLSITQEDLNG